MTRSHRSRPCTPSGRGGSGPAPESASERTEEDREALDITPPTEIGTRMPTTILGSRLYQRKTLVCQGFALEFLSPTTGEEAKREPEPGGKPRFQGKNCLSINNLISENFGRSCALGQRVILFRSIPPGVENWAESMGNVLIPASQIVFPAFSTRFLLI